MAQATIDVRFDARELARQVRRVLVRFARRSAFHPDKHARGLRKAMATFRAPGYQVLAQGWEDGLFVVHWVGR